MAFFQNSVINKYIQKLDKQTIQSAYALFRNHFHNATIQENIRSSKEEQYQGEFLIDLFVNVLGYTKSPTPNFNLTTEYKNVKDSKKADGAIIINEIVKAVIELKGTNTTDLNKIEVQAFGYKNNQPECEYVVTSNFEKLRFYVDNAVEYLEFNLFTLTEKEFELLYLCLSYDSISKGLPKQIKDESVSQESLITRKLYNDYSVFKHELYQNLVKLNPQYEPLELFKKSQKLLDRFLFIFFAEDRQLLPTNLIFRINREWQQLREMRIDVSLYDRYKIYFNDLDCGATVSLPAFSQTASKQKEEFQIYAYNGGLFKNDDLLNDIKIEDGLLFIHTERLSNYDFASEVDVNVLGHIFENSLNDLDEIKAQLEGQVIDKTKTKRKKDGVFYTPKYITKYIVDNTVGKLCVEKKEELQLTERDYTIDKKRQKKITQALTDKLNDYRNWLLQLTICDPACGSGAFLNQALDFLITEHRYIDELQAKLFGDALVLSDVEGSILENNLFGVDINEESVEIAKLSLWLRTAQPNRKLNDLNSNIKCGNSLINDASVAGDKAFNWEQEFPQVFQNAKHDKDYINVETRLSRKNVFATKDSLGNYKDDSYGLYNEFHEPATEYKSLKEKKHGFDVVIGNPPYVRQELLGQKQKDYFSLNYRNVYNGLADLYVYFYDLSFKILKSNGKMGFITPNKWLERKYGFEIRNYLIQLKIDEIVNLNKISVFDDAIADPSIFIFTNLFDINYPVKYKCPINIEELYNGKSENFEKGKFQKDMWRFSSNDNQGIINKFKSGGVTIKEYTKGGVYYGVKTGLNQAFIINEETRKKIINQDKNSDEIIKKMVEGDDFKRWHLNQSGRYMITTFPSKKIDIEKFIGVKTYLSSFGSRIEQSGEKGSRKKSFNKWFETQDTISYSELFKLPKIIYYHTAINHNFYFDLEGYYISANCYFIGNADRYIQCLLNSKLFDFIKFFLFPHFGDVENSRGVRLDGNIMNNLPIKEISNNEKELFKILAELITSQSRILEDLRLKLINYINSKWAALKFSRKLSAWYELDFSEFIKELNKAIKEIKGTPLNKKDEFEWMELFEENKKKALELKSKIDTTDKEIDQMVYKLYDLTEEEIAIVENS